MKAKTTCPHCKKEIVVDVPEGTDQHELTCPNCSKTFKIKRSQDMKDTSTGRDCTWEECGEPRKTVLSKLRRYSNRPLIVSFLLFTAGVLGIFTAVFFFTTNGHYIDELGFIGEILNILATERLLVSIVIILCSFFTIVGAFSAYLRRYFGVTVICAILGIFAIGFVIGLILAILALVLLIFARDEFKHEINCRTF
ncbi:MAG: hypothetical protein KKC68_01770 [Candidatus Thermoplasmatota archaeon]|nr:hypothetical protein [Candidatus Thermoplasmatota archaeon]MBU1940476.1 hypothetical protein [Candidatus Thermoplasmatota archaeon]